MERHGLCLKNTRRMTWALGAVAFLKDKCLFFHVGLGLVGFWKVSETEGHVEM